MDKSLEEILKNAPLCPVCITQMGAGYAIDAEDDYCCRGRWYAVVTYESMRIIGCWKCPKCGHSETYEG